MTVINTNISANIARDAIGRNDRAMATSMERLSTGLRINSAKDDAAGLAIANRMAGQISGLNMAHATPTTLCPWYKQSRAPRKKLAIC